MNRRQFLALSGGLVAVAALPANIAPLRKPAGTIVRMEISMRDVLEYGSPIPRYLSTGRGSELNQDIFNVIARRDGKTVDQVMDMFQTWFEKPWFTMFHDFERDLYVLLIQEYPWPLPEGLNLFEP